ncbi:MAG: hypothetical protein ACO1NO_08425 [Burkholderiaceae bacterium]
MKQEASGALNFIGPMHFTLSAGIMPAAAQIGLSPDTQFSAQADTFMPV